MSKKEQKPRLVYPPSGNILLVQRVYLCEQGRKTHTVHATSTDLMKTLPFTIQTGFPLILYKRSGWSKKLLKFIKNSLVKGVNFLQISESLASLNHDEYARLGTVFNMAREDGLTNGEPFNFDDFYSNDLFSFTGTFINEFQKNENANITEMFKTTATSLSCDHTFKISIIRFVAKGEEKKFKTQFLRMFIVFNEYGQVLDWRFTASTAFEEVDYLLSNLQKRVENRRGKINMICIDDCKNTRK